MKACDVLSHYVRTSDKQHTSNVLYGQLLVYDALLTGESGEVFIVRALHITDMRTNLAVNLRLNEGPYITEDKLSR